MLIAIWTYDTFVAHLADFAELTNLLPNATLFNEAGLDSLDAARIQIFFDLLGLPLRQEHLGPTSTLASIYCAYVNLASSRDWYPEAIILVERQPD
jgi:hypothetical protein